VIFYCLTVLFDARRNVTCLKLFARYGHYLGEMKDTIIARLAFIIRQTQR